MTIWNAIVLGLVQGLTEFLPISSSGHLSIMTNLFDVNSTEGGYMFFTVLLNIGSFLALILLYWQDIKKMAIELLALVNLGPMAGVQRQRYPAARMFFMLLIASIPLFFILPLRKKLSTLYFNNIFIAISIILTGCMLFVSDKMKEGNKGGGNMTVLDAVIIGLCQCASAVPGLSRPATTITAGIAAGLKRTFAVRFAFLLSVPVMFGMNILNLIDSIKMGIDTSILPACFVGMLVSMLAGIVAILVVRYLAQKGKLGTFAYYCWVMGVLSIILTLIF